jgi:hypothetical protein
MKWALVAGGLLFAGPALADDACESLKLQQALALEPQIDCPSPAKPIKSKKTVAPAFAGNIRDWRNPVKGTHATLGDDGGGSDKATVCQTTDEYSDFLKGDPGYTVPGCKEFERGLPVTIIGVDFDKTRDAASGSSSGEPLVQISIPSKKWVGYVQLLGGIHPIIPVGTKIHLKRDGNATINLAAKFDADYGSGPDLGEHVTVKMIRSAPDYDMIYVSVIDGPFAGKTGWVLRDGTDDAGDYVSLFDGAVVAVTPRAAERREGSPRESRLWRGDNNWNVVYRPEGTDTGSCTMFNGRNIAEHALFWKWDVTMLTLGYVGPPPAGEPPPDWRRDAGSRLIISIDGHELLSWVVSYLDVVDQEGVGPRLVVRPRGVSWDQNNEGHDTGPETADIFNLLRHGHTLTIMTYGQTYIDDLTGVGSALALFPACIHYKDFQ